MTKLKLLFFVIVCITVFSCFSETKTIKIDKIGVSFKIPSNFIIRDAAAKRKPIAKNSDLKNKYGISYGYEKIEKDFLSDFDFSNKDEIIKKLKNEDDKIFLRNRNITHDFFKYKNKIIGEGIFLSSANFSFSCILYFIKDDYFVTIVVNYYNPFRTMQKKYPQYFEKQPDDIYLWKNPDEIFKMIMNGDKKAPEELVKLYDYFQQIKDSIKFY